MCFRMHSGKRNFSSDAVLNSVKIMTCNALSLRDLILILALTFGSCRKSSSVVSDSMAPNLKSGDVVEFESVSLHEIRPGDVVVVISPINLQDYWLRRVIAIGPAVVGGNLKELSIDSKTYNVDYFFLSGEIEQPFGPVIIPKNGIFLLGDNLRNSRDGREFGFTRIDEVIGRVSTVNGKSVMLRTSKL